MRMATYVFAAFIILAGFGLDAFALLKSLQAPTQTLPVPAQGGIKPDDILTVKEQEEQLFKMQESVLDSVKESNAKTKDELDFAILAAGFVVTAALAIFGFFGLKTARDAQELRAGSERLLGELREALQKAKEAEQEAKKAVREAVDLKQTTIAEIKQGVTPRLAEIANYGMQMASFAASSWKTASFEDKIHACKEAAATIRKADLGDDAKAALSFVLAREGIALFENGRIHEARDKFVLARDANVLHKPDRHYNLACAYARIAATATDQTEAEANRELALDELQSCFAMALDAKAGNTDSKLYFRRKCLGDNTPSPALAPDSDLDSIRHAPRFLLITAAP